MALGSFLSVADGQQAVRQAPAPRRIALCLDGTWNSAYNEQKRRDGHAVLKPTNVLKVCRGVVPFADDGTMQISYYALGVGSLAEYPGAANRLLYLSDRTLGGAWGAGFEGNVEDALHFLAINYEVGDELFIFGFSRGAATARAVTQFLDWNHGLPEKGDAYYLPRLFRAYVISHGAAGEQERMLAEINADRANEHPPRAPLKAFRPTPVKYLGLWDTVMALGSRFEATAASTAAGARSFYAGNEPARCVAHARQALAVDEHRFDFRPEVWVGAGQGQTMEQRWFAGVHSNVGGGYVNDGVANVAFRWILEGATAQGLEIDPDYVKHFRPYVQDSLYESASLLYRALDFIRFRSGRGKRRLDAYAPAANLALDPSVIRRMQAKTVLGSDDQPTAPYRPENVMVFLAGQPDLDAYLKAIGVTEPLPDDVVRRIGELKSRGGAPNIHPAAAKEVR